jgi:two-component system, response regulator PdtaR
MAKLRILIVENTILVRLAVEEMLANLGHDRVGWAATVPRAIAEAERLRPDLVLMDIQLDDNGDGIEAARAIRERFNIPSLFMTGGIDHEKWQRAMATEPVGYLQKPFLQSGLAAALENFTPASAPVIVATTLGAAVEAAMQVLGSAPEAAPVAAKAKPPETSHNSDPSAPAHGSNKEPDAVG